MSGDVNPEARSIGLSGGLGGYQPDFEINTDAALVDPGWDDFAESHDRRFGLAISHFKSSVKGRTLDNEVMTVRVGKNGYYTQSRRFPGAFFGDTAEASVEAVSESEARAAIWEAVAHYRAEEAQSMVCVYSGEDPPDFFFGYRLNDDRRYEVGMLRNDLPLHLRVMFDAAQNVPLIGARTGVLLYQRTRSGKHMLVRAQGRRSPLLSAARHGS